MSISSGLATVLACAAAALLLLLLVTAEVRRMEQQHLPGRIAATVLTVLALLMLVLEPSVPRRVRPARAVLLTEGASQSEARKVADSVGAERVLTLGDSIPDLGTLQRLHPDVRELVIVGSGLPAAELRRSGSLGVDFVPRGDVEGISRLSWPRRIPLGATATIDGIAPPEEWVRLESPGHPQDSVRAGADGSFRFELTPRAAGLALFTLQSGGRTDTAGIDVRNVPPPRVLMIEAAPDFETSRLREWLARRGGQVATRTEITRGRWRSRAENGAPLPGRALAAALLEQFDVLVLDDRSLRRLSSGERTAVRDAVADGGLGVFVTGAPPPPIPGLPLPIARPGARSAGTIRVRRPQDARASPPVRAEPLRFTLGAGTGVMLVDADGAPAAIWQVAGAGRTGLSAVGNPSRWLLEGDSLAFGTYWSAILSALARPQDEWRLSPGDPPSAGHPVAVAWTGALDTAVIVSEARIDTLHLMPDADSLDWAGVFWPREPGRHEIRGPLDTLRLHVASGSAWPGVRAAGRTAATRRHAALHRSGPPGVERSARVAVPSWIFFLLFAAPAAWLWWERRQAGIADSGKEGRTGVE